LIGLRLIGLRVDRFEVDRFEVDRFEVDRFEVDRSRKIKNLRFLSFFVDPQKKMKSKISVFSGLMGFPIIL